MEPQFLRQLAEVIDLGSLSLAARSLNVSQPTLSRNIKSLEALVGAPVVRRGRYGVTPTAVGELLAREGRSIRAALRQVQLDISNWQQGLDGRLHIGVGTMLAHSLMPRFLSKTDIEDWNVVLRIDVESADKLLERVRERFLDVAVIEFGAVFAKDGLTQISLLEDRRAFFVGETHPLANSETISEQDLVDASHITVGSFSTDFDFFSVPLARRRGPLIEMSGDVAIALNLLATGRYVAALPEFVMEHLCDPRRFKRLPYSGRMPSRSLSIFHRAEMSGHPLIKGFCNRFEKFVRSLRTEGPG